ncbi:uncharacterized protein LOC100378776 [Saccoglossus kowalevskii]|uniref:Uncharacterized protein LOC100378776 n=1 Tax=Saccoglossus kowalevskii TaxID=10224 RepID=A0ABM0GUI2_SACKO|nr:PREDICTED: uncharacterized protein LOC100378776 [Saccoglossus kowalevskii]
MSKTNVKTKVQNAFDQFCEGYRTKDMKMMLDTMRSDAQYLAPEEKLATGKEDIAKIIKKYLEKYIDVNIDVHETGLASEDGHVYSLGAYRIHKADGSAIETGKTLTIWDMKDDQCLLYRNMWNGDSA